MPAENIYTATSEVKSLAEQEVPKDLLGFLSIERTTEGDGYIGALMVTDYRGYPLEFRATTPIRPTLVQKALYGAQLDHYVGIQLCARSLVQQITRNPKVLLVPGSELLDVADEVERDVLAIWVAGDSLARANGSELSEKSGGRQLAYEARFPLGTRESEILSVVERCGAHFDLVETFGRIRNALVLLAQEDKKFA